MISHYAWPGGLAFVVEAPRRRLAAVLDQTGWRHGDLRRVWRDGPPAGADQATLSLPSWLIEQLPSLECSLAGLHTDVVRMNRLLARLQATRASGFILVIGHSPAAIAVTDGVPAVVVPAGPDGEHPDMVMARAVGWVVVFTGPITVSTESAQPDQTPVERVATTAPPPAEPVPEQPLAALIPETQAAAPEVAAPEVAAPEVVAPKVAVPEGAAPEAVVRGDGAASSRPAETVSTAGAAEPARLGIPATPVAPGTGNGAGLHGDERFVASPGAARAFAEDLAAAIDPSLRDAGQKVVEALDGSRTLVGIAESTGLSIEQVAQVVRVLATARLAFRYVSRARPTTGARAP